jgi:hypothetical protein
MSLETALLGNDLKLGHPDWFHLQECLRERQFDRRWTMEVVAAFRDDELVGAMPISTCRGNVIPDANIRLELYRQAPERVGGDPHRLMFLGGFAYLRGGVCLSSTVEARESAAVIAAVVRSGLDTARTRSLVPHALFVPDLQLEPTVAAWQPRPRICEAPRVAFLPVPPCADLDEFASTLPRSPRDNWRSDKSRLAAAGIDAVAVEMTEDLLAEAAPGIAAVKIKNGVADHPRLTAMRLRSWFSGLEPNLTRAWTVRDRNANLLGISIAVIDRRVLQTAEIGLAQSHPSRREIYLELAFRAPVRACIEDSLEGVDLGAGSLPSKQRRGAILRRQWHLL